MLNLTEVQYIQMEYQNSKGEKSAYLVDVLKNPFECIGIDIETLTALSFEDGYLEQAREELLNKLLYPKKQNFSDGNGTFDSCYEFISRGIKRNVVNGKIYLEGFLESKEIIEAASKEDRRLPMTKAKDFIKERYMLSTKFRKFLLTEDILLKGQVVDGILFL